MDHPVDVGAVRCHDARDHDDDVGGDEGWVAADAVGEDPEAQVAHSAAEEEHGLGERRDPVLVAHPVVLRQKAMLKNILEYLL